MLNLLATKPFAGHKCETMYRVPAASKRIVHRQGKHKQTENEDKGGQGITSTNQEKKRDPKSDKVKQRKTRQNQRNMEKQRIPQQEKQTARVTKHK